MANRINVDTYNLHDEWINKVAGNYLDLSQENLLRAGLFGYVNEVMANNIEDINFMTNLYYNEIIPIRANLPDSIYAYASQVNFEGFTAKPSKQNFILAIKKEDIINYSTDKMTHREFRIEKNSYLQIDSTYNFLLDYPIDIIIKKDPSGKTDFIFTPMYDLVENNPISDIDNPYIASTVGNLNGHEFLFLNIFGRELKHEQQKFNILSTDIVNSISFEVKYTGQVAYFQVYYKENPNAEPELLEKYFIDELEPTAEKFCFYKFLSNESLEIFFSPYNGYFKPEFNSSIIVELYTTNGSKCNFHYTGSESYFIFDEDLGLEKETIIRYDNVVTVTYISEPSYGGTDIESLSKIKKKVIEQLSIRRNIITESDLNSYFNQNNNDSTILFIKKRDDVFKRIFSAFILAKDTNGNILPTNTVQLKIKEADIHAKSDALGIYMFDNNTLTESESDVYVPSKNNSSNKLAYMNPFLMKFNLNPLSTIYYNTYCNKSYPFNFSYISKTSLYEFIINSLEVYRDPSKSKNYEFKFEMATSVGLENLFKTTEEGKLQDLGVLKVKGIITSANNNVGYIDFKPIALNHANKRIVYKAVLKTNDYIDNAERIEIQNSIKMVVGGSAEVRPRAFINDSNVKLEVCVYHKNGSTEKLNKLHNLDELEEFNLTNVYTLNEDLKLFYNLNRMVYTTVDVEKDQNNDLIFRCDSVPVVSKDYFLKEGSKSIYSIIDFFSSYLKENLNNLQNNFDLDIKFFNTYGKSKWFTIGLNGEALDFVNLIVKFRIKTDIELDEYQKDSIKIFIKNYIESINEENLKSIYVSNLIRMIENEFKYVLYVEFLGFNNYDTNIQIIESRINSFDELSTKNIVNNFIPEYLNINKLQNKDGKFEPEVQIEFI